MYSKDFHRYPHGLVQQQEDSDQGQLQLLRQPQQQRLQPQPL